MADKIQVGVYGASGFAGMDLIGILSKHPHVDLIFATSNTYRGDDVMDTSLQYIPHAEAPLDAVDTVFLALPHKVSAPVVKMCLDRDIQVIDLSADLRINSPEEYAKWYDVEHPHPELLPTPYGLPEINRVSIQDQKAIAVPGCYPTASILGLYPLLETKALKKDAPIIIDAKSGISGAGREPKPKTHFVTVYGDLIPYNVGRKHRHVGEMEQEIHKVMDEIGDVIFVPHLIPVDRGLMASITVTVNENFSPVQAQTLYEEVYQQEPLVDVLPAGQHATLKQVASKNHCAISITPIEDKYVHITSVIDNLRKGASGQAVQNFNIMNNFEETMALL